MGYGGHIGRGHEYLTKVQIWDAGVLCLVDDDLIHDAVCRYRQRRPPCWALFLLLFILH